MHENKEITKIFDSIHGTIHLKPHEIEIIDTPQFQRLRRINQLGFASYVFPEANHTRFSHSLGVLAVIDRLCTHLKIQDEKERYDLRLAALLHDVGHFPFSHTLEVVYEKIKNEATHLTDATADKTKNLICEQESESKKPSSYHEQCSSIVAQSILRSTANEIGENRIQRIASTITGQCPNPSYFNQLLHASVDADNMDYLLRDSAKTGIPYGNYDFCYLSEAFAFDESNPIDRKVVIKRKGLNALEHFYLAKYYWYTQILNHPSLAIVENMAKYIAYCILKGKYVNQEITNRLLSYGDWERLIRNSDKKEFTSYDDAFFLNVVREVSLNLEVDRDFRVLCVALLRRIIPELKYEKKIFLSNKNKSTGNKKLNSIESEFQKMANSVNNGVLPKNMINEIHSFPDSDNSCTFMYESKGVLRKYKPDEAKSSVEQARDIPKIELDSDRYILSQKKGKFVFVNEFEDSILHSLLDEKLYIFRIYDFERFYKEAEKYIE